MSCLNSIKIEWFISSTAQGTVLIHNFQKTVKADSKYAFHLYCFGCIAVESYLLDVRLLPREDRAALLPDPDELR
jgi:hypothetical protein